jgi:peptide chain release factor subunit 1
VESVTSPLVPKGVTWQTLRELAEFRSANACAISLYLDLDPSATPTPAALDTRFNSALSEIEKRYLADEEDGTRRRAIRSDLERIRRFWEQELDRDGARGLAIFSAEEDGFFRVLHLAEPVRDHACVDRALTLAPLVGHIGRHEGAIVAAMNRERGQIFRVRNGRLEEVLDETEEQPGQHQQGGWSQARYQRHLQKLFEDHLKTVGEEIDKRVRRTRVPMLVIVAPEELRPEIEATLSQEAKEALVGWATAEAHADANALLDAARPELDHALAERENEALARWREEMGKGARGAAGWHDTLEAASDARVETLLLTADGAAHTAYRCPECGRATAAAGACPLDGAELEAGDARDLAIHQTLAHGGTVLTVGGDLLGGEGVGALLRF